MTWSVNTLKWRENLQPVANPPGERIPTKLSVKPTVYAVLMRHRDWRLWGGHAGRRADDLADKAL
jgi:hypothetical protein